MDLEKELFEWKCWKVRLELRDMPQVWLVEVQAVTGTASSTVSPCLGCVANREAAWRKVGMFVCPECCVPMEIGTDVEMKAGREAWRSGVLLPVVSLRCGHQFALEAEEAVDHVPAWRYIKGLVSLVPGCLPKWRKLRSREEYRMEVDVARQVVLCEQCLDKLDEISFNPDDGYYSE